MCPCILLYAYKRYLCVYICNNVCIHTTKIDLCIYKDVHTKDRYVYIYKHMCIHTLCIQKIHMCIYVKMCPYIYALCIENVSMCIYT